MAYAYLIGHQNYFLKNSNGRNNNHKNLLSICPTSLVVAPSFRNCQLHVISTLLKARSASTFDLVLGLEFLSVIVERNRIMSPPNLQIHRSINIISVFPHGNSKNAIVNFSFKISYTPDVGSISLKGDLIIGFGSDVDIGDFLTLWNGRKLPLQIAELFHKFLTKLLFLKIKNRDYNG